MTLFIGNSYVTPTIIVDGSSPTPTPGIPTSFGSRIDNKATVVGVLKDHQGNDYVLAVVDAAYRSSSAMSWGPTETNTPLENWNDQTGAKGDAHSGKYNTDLILDTYTATNYPAFNFARNACTVTIGSNTYYSVLPTVREIQLLYDNKDSLDQYDPTVSSYSGRSMSSFTFGAKGAWSSSEKNSDAAWTWFWDYFTTMLKNGSSDSGVCPVICIPLD